MASAELVDSLEVACCCGIPLVLLSFPFCLIPCFSISVLAFVVWPAQVFCLFGEPAADATLYAMMAENSSPRSSSVAGFGFTLLQCSVQHYGVKY